MMRSFIICIYHQYIQMITSRGTRWPGVGGGVKKNVYSFSGETRRKVTTRKVYA